MTPFTVKQITAEETYDLRQKILRPGHEIASVHFACDQANSTIHAGVFSQEHIVGVSTVSLNAPHDDPFAQQFAMDLPQTLSWWQVRGMATSEDVQSQGIGSVALNEAIRLTLNQDPQAVFWCNARIEALGFYQKHGWTICSESYE